MKKLFYITSMFMVYGLPGCFPSKEADRDPATPAADKKSDKESGQPAANSKIEIPDPVVVQQAPVKTQPVAQVTPPNCEFKSLKTADFGKGYTECWTRVKDGEVAEKYPDGSRVCIEKNNVQNVAGSIAGIGSYNMYRDLQRSCWIEEKHIQK